MPKEVMKRKAADNAYLHKDFHSAMSGGIEYLRQRYGRAAVREYLRQFTISFYAPLIADLKQRGLIALKEHFERIYKLEGGAVEMSLSSDALEIKVAACPAVQHMRTHGYPVSPLFVETTRTVNAALCEGTAFASELVGYDPETGRSSQRFFRRHL